MGAFEKLFTEWERKIMKTVENVVLDGLQNTNPYLKSIVEEYMIRPSIEEYYDEYDANDRQYSLFDTFDVKLSFKGYELSGSITPNPDNLPPHYSKSEYHQSGGTWASRNGYKVLKEVKNDDDKWLSSRSFNYDGDDNGTPDNAWIVHNLIEGIHPFTITKKLGGGESSYEYLPIQGVPLYERFKRHEPEAQEQIMIRVIYSIKQECKKYF